VWRDDRCGAVVKGNDDGGWSSEGVVLWLGRRQNGDAVEWWREWPRLRWPYYSSREWESGYPGRVVGGGGADLMLQFWLERGGALPKDEAEAESSSWFHGKEVWHGMMAWQHRSEERRHPGGERNEMTPVGLMWILLGRKMKKIQTIDSIVTNGR
jgi:hypothetical protein